jgi:IS1 family transposase
LEKTLERVCVDDILEFDEVWSYVRCKKQQRWLWTVISRKTRQIIAYVIGDRSLKTFKKLIRKISSCYLSLPSFSDFWECYKTLESKGNHQCVGKETGETCHMERWNCTLRQRISRYVRKTLSFSKKDSYHHIHTRLFIQEYNLTLRK